MVVVAVLGVAGQAGVQIASELLKKGGDSYRIIGVARSPEKVPSELSSNGRVQIVKGDIEKDDIATLINGADVVVSAYSPGAEVNKLLTVTDRLIAAIKPNQRLIAVGGAGGLTVAANGKLTIEQEWFPAEYKPIAQAHIEATEKYKKSTNLNWSIAAPAAIIFPGPRLGTYRTAVETLVVNDKFESKISYADFGIAVADEIINAKFKNVRWTAAY